MLSLFVMVGGENTNFFLVGLHEFPELEDGDANESVATRLPILWTLEEDEPPVATAERVISTLEEGEHRRWSGNGEWKIKSSEPTRNRQKLDKTDNNLFKYEYKFVNDCQKLSTRA